MESSNHDVQRTGLYPYKLKKLRMKILTQQRFRCKACKKDVIIHNLRSELHHIDENPKNNTRANLEVLCLDCHIDLHPDRENWMIKQRERLSCPICDSSPKSPKHILCSRCYYIHHGFKDGV